MLKNLLIYRLIIFNVCGAAFLIWAWQRGYITTLFDGDTSRICYLIAALWAVGLYSTAIRAATVSGQINRLKAARARSSMSALSVSAPKLLEKAAHLDDIPNSLVTLGLIGTVVGSAMALNGIDSSLLTTAAGVQKIAGQFINGASVAIYTTIVGAILGLWTEVNRRMLKTATIALIEDAR